MDSEIVLKVITCVESVIRKSINPKNIELSLIDEHGIDSLDIANILIGLESTFNIEIDVGLIVPTNIRSVGALSSMVLEVLNMSETNR